jgi:Bacterial low temperature requirement A protein (LtrA)
MTRSRQRRGAFKKTFTAGGGQVLVESIRSPLHNPDFAPYIPRVKDAKPDAVFMAFLTSLLGSIVMWWLYSATTPDAGRERLSHSRNPGRLARLAYTHIHILLVAGIVVSAILPTQRPDSGQAVVLTPFAVFRTGTFQSGRTKWHVYPFGMRSR